VPSCLFGGFAGGGSCSAEDSRAKAQGLSWDDEVVFLGSVVPLRTALARLSIDHGGATTGTFQNLLVLSDRRPSAVSSRWTYRRTRTPGVLASWRENSSWIVRLRADGAAGTALNSGRGSADDPSAMHAISDEPARPAFILSTERSGSTLLRWLLDAHHEVASPGEVLLGRLCFDLFVTLSRTVCAPANASGDVAERRAANFATLARVRTIVDGIMREYAGARGKRVWCDKTPHNLAYLTVLVDTFPDARYVCLYRDGRDVARSCLEVSRDGFMAELVEYARRSPHDLVGAMLDSWCEKTELLLKMELHHRDLCHRVRYEDLVARPDEVLPPLCTFLGVAWDPSLVERAFAMRHDEGGGDQRIKETKGIERDRAGRGRALDTAKLSPARRTRVDSLLRALGYPELERPSPTMHA